MRYRWPLIAPFLLLNSLAMAADPTPEDLMRLRAEGKFAEAAELVEKLAAQENLSKDWQTRLDLERGLNAMAASRAATEPAERDAQHKQALQSLDKFLGDHPDHPSAMQALLHYAELQLDQARRQIESAKKLPDASERAQAIKAAQNTYMKADENAAAILAACRHKINELGDAAEQKLPLEVLAIQAGIMRGIAGEEVAAAQEDRGQRAQEYLRAAKHYNEVYNQHRRRLVGLYARLGEARCREQAGDTENAVKICEELLELPGEPDPFRVLRTKAVAQLANCWLSSNQKKYDRVIDVLSPYVENQRKSEEKDPDWLTLHTRLGLAFTRKSAEISDPRRKALLLERAKESFATASHPGPHEDELKSAKAELAEAEK